MQPRSVHLPPHFRSALPPRLPCNQLTPADRSMSFLILMTSHDHLLCCTPASLLEFARPLALLLSVSMVQPPREHPEESLPNRPKDLSRLDRPLIVCSYRTGITVVGTYLGEQPLPGRD